MDIIGKAVRIYETGGPKVLKYEDVSLDRPKKGQVRLKHHAIGLNFIDINMRNGAYNLKAFSPDAQAPYILGMEASGEIESIGEDVVDFKVGDRVTHCMNLGAYSEVMNIAADRLILLPSDISYEIAAASTLQGLTAHYLVNELWKVKKSHNVLIHSAAGGVGLLLCQWAKYIGSNVIGVVSTEEKSDYAKKFGCDHAIISSKENFVKRVKALTGGRGVDVIYDAVGKDTFLDGVACLAPRGRLVSYGVSSGPIESFNINLLRPLSASVACGGLLTFTKDPTERSKNASELHELIAKGILKVEINQRYHLNEVDKAHTELSGRMTSGSSIILP